MARKIEIFITGDARGLQRAMGQAHRSTLGLGGAFRKLGRIAAYAGGAVGIYGLVRSLEKVVHSALSAETAQARLAKSFENSHLSLRPYLKQIEQVETASRKLGFTDIDTKNALGSLLTATGSYTKAAKDLSTVQDTARFRGTDLAAATKMVTMAMTGSQRAVKQLGLTISPVTAHMDALGKKATDAQKAHAKLLDKFATGDSIIAKLTERVKGQGKAFADTTQGGIEKMRAAIEHLEVTIGTLLLPTLQRFANWVSDKAAPAIEKFIKGVDFHAIGEQIKGPIDIAVNSLKNLVHGVIEARRVLGPDIFSGLVIGILGASGVLHAITALKGAWVSLVALFGSSGPAALAFVGLAVAIGGLAAVMLHNRAAANSLGDAYKDAANSAKDLKSAEDNLKQTSLDVEQAHIRQKLAADNVRAAEDAYSKAVKESGLHSRAAVEAGHQLTQAKLDQKQANLDATKAEREHGKALDDAGKKQRAITENVVKAAEKQKGYQSTLGAIDGALSKVTFGLSKNSQNYQDVNKKADEFAKRMQAISDKLKTTHPKISAAYGAVANLAAALHRVPSDTEIRFIVKSLNIGGFGANVKTDAGGRAEGGRIPGARQAADSVPAMLSPGEFVVTGGGEQMLEDMTFPGVLDWLEGSQPAHFAKGGRAGDPLKKIIYTRLFPSGVPGTGAGSTRGLVPRVLRALNWAKGHGWGGQVTSGWRSYDEQAALYQRYLAGGPLAAKPGSSSHETGQAVDVTKYGQFGATMGIAPLDSRLYNFLGARDPVHWSVSGYGLGGRIRSAWDKANAPGRYIDKQIGRGAHRVMYPRGRYNRPSVVHWNPALKHWVYETTGNEHDKRNPWIPFNKDLPRSWFIGQANKYGAKGLRPDDVYDWWSHKGWKQRHARTGGRIRFQHGGRVGGTPKWIAAAEDRAAKTHTLEDDIASFEQEQTWLSDQLSKPKLGARRRESLQGRMGTVQRKLTTLRRQRRTRNAAKARRAARAAKDYSQLPASIREKIAKARYDDDKPAELAALLEGQRWLRKQLLRKRLTHEQRAAIYDALTSIGQDIKDLQDEITGGTEPGGSEDLQAQLDQANARNADLQRQADLANAFVATGVFGGGGGGGGGTGGSSAAGGGGVNINMGFMIPDAQQLQAATAAVVSGLGRQGFRQATTERLGV